MRRKTLCTISSRLFLMDPIYHLHAINFSAASSPEAEV